MKATWTRNLRSSVVLGVVAAAIAGGFLAGRARAAGIPATGALSYSGVLEDVNGVTLSGSKQIKVALFDAQLVGTQQCTVTQTVALVNGRFQVLLPDTCTQAVQANPNLWVEVTVDNSSLGRTKLGAVPYAAEASHAVSATTATTAATANAAGGSLGTTVAGLQTDVTALKGRVDLKVTYKSGNNGTVSCGTFCAGSWGGWTGTCVAAQVGATGAFVDCGTADSSSNFMGCWCAHP